MPKYQVHKDYELLNVTVPMRSQLLPILQQLIRVLYARQAVPGTLDHQKISIPASDGRSIEAELFSPRNRSSDLPCLVYFHGGAFALPATDFHKKMVCEYALACNITIFFVDYRLVPKHPYPCGLEDCYEAYAWLLDHGKALGIDKERIAVGGDSAGGALAAALTLMSRDRSFPMPLFQLLIYPVLDAACESDSMRQFTDSPIWNTKQNKKMWNLYLANNPKAKEDAYASPLNTPSFYGLPKAYIEVNEIDCLRDEAISYSKRLSEAGIEVVLNQTKGTVHGFEVNYQSSYTQSIIKERIAYMKQQFLT